MFEMTHDPNTLRRSTAPEGATVLNNYPDRYPTQDWMARYWTVSEAGELEPRQVTLQLPTGFSEPCMPVSVGLWLLSRNPQRNRLRFQAPDL